jgi:hypothetical protein
VILAALRAFVAVHAAVLMLHWFSLAKQTEKPGHGSEHVMEV